MPYTTSGSGSHFSMTFLLLTVSLKEEAAWPQLAWPDASQGLNTFLLPSWEDLHLSATIS